jgi:hypothetical protein
VLAIVRGTDDAPRRPGNGKARSGPGAWLPYTAADPFPAQRNGHHPADADHR